MTRSNNVLVFRPIVRRRPPLQAPHAYSHLCACAVCRVRHEDRMSDIRDAIYRCREALRSTSDASYHA